MQFTSAAVSYLSGGKAIVSAHERRQFKSLLLLRKLLIKGRELVRWASHIYQSYLELCIVCISD